MKTLMIAFTTAFFANIAHAAPVLMEREYINHAWGYTHQGCLVDLNGYAYTYDIQSKKELKKIAKLDDTDLAEVKELIELASKGKVTEKHAAFDAGVTTWAAQYNGRTITLKKIGDYVATNSSSAAQELVTIIDELCAQ